MAQSLSQIYLHVVFSTAGAAAHLGDRAFRQRTHTYLEGVSKNLGSPTLIVGGTANHVHLLCRMSRKLTVSDYLRELKRDSAHWIAQQDSNLWRFEWQQGYGAFSISPSHVDPLLEYIRNQERHHRHETFQQEFLRLLEKYDVEYDEEFLWE